MDLARRRPARRRAARASKRLPRPVLYDTSMDASATGAALAVAPLTFDDQLRVAASEIVHRATVTMSAPQHARTGGSWSVRGCFAAASSASSP